MKMEIVASRLSPAVGFDHFIAVFAFAAIGKIGQPRSGAAGGNNLW